MSEQSKRLWVGGARAITGVVIIGIAVVVSLALGSGLLPAPAVERGVVAVQVDIGQSSQTQVVCPGSFAELGVDPTQPTMSVPSGDTTTVVAGDPQNLAELNREIAGGTPPFEVAGRAGQPLAAAELQKVATPNLQGLVATACAAPAHEQWLVGGSTGLGVSTTLVLGNPFEVPATVVVTVFDQDGQLDQQKIAGVLVPAGSQRIVSINGYAPARDRFAVRVSSTGAAVTASLGVSHTVDIRSYAVDTVSRQLAPSTTQVFPGVQNVLAHDHGPTAEVQEVDEFPMVVRVLAPGGERGSAQIQAMMPDGTQETLGTVEFANLGVVDFAVPHWPEEAQGVVVTASAPIVAGIFGTADQAPEHDYAWFAPAPLLPADTNTAVALVPGGQLVLANPSSAEAEVTFDTGVRVTVPAGAAVVAPAEAVPNGSAELRSSAPITAGVRVVSGARIAGYPVLPAAEAATALTVYPR